MAQTKISEIKDLSAPELNKRLKELKQERINLRLQQVSGQLENPSRLRLVRREVARIMTVINQGK